MVNPAYLPSWLRDRPPPSTRGRADRSEGETPDLEAAALPPSEGARNLGGWIGYRRFVDGIQAYCVMRGKQGGNLYVQWLKDHFTVYPPAAAFWVGILARMALRHDVAFDAVTCPPSSGKRAAYLAEALAQGVAETLGVPFEPVFFNPDPRGHRASMQEKLRESDGPDAARYEYTREPSGAHILVVDDAICTRQTALRCVRAAAQAAREAARPADSLYFVVIYS